MRGKYKKKQSRKSVDSASVNDYTASLIYGACQIGLGVSAEDMSPNLLMAIASYAEKVTSKDGNGEAPAMSLSEMRRAR